jgi:hypothetical protein
MMKLTSSDLIIIQDVRIHFISEHPEVAIETFVINDRDRFTGTITGKLKESGVLVTCDWAWVDETFIEFTWRKRPTMGSAKK